MAEPVTLADMKADLRMGAGASDEDARIERLIVAARRAVERATGHTIVGEAPTLPMADLPSAAQAISLIVATWFAVPEGVNVDGKAAAEMPLGVSYLLGPITKWADD